MATKSVDEKINSLNQTLNSCIKGICGPVEDLKKQIKDVKDEVKAKNNQCDCSKQLENVKSDISRLEDQILKPNVDKITEIIESENEFNYIKELSENNKVRLDDIHSKIIKLDEEKNLLEQKILSTMNRVNLAEKSEFDENKKENDPTVRQIRDTTETLSCKICERKYRNFEVLMKHINEDHKKYIKCKICCQEFRKKCNLENHIVDLHEEVYRYKCDSCDMAFPLK